MQFFNPWRPLIFYGEKKPTCHKNGEIGASFGQSTAGEPEKANKEQESIWDILGNMTFYIF